MSRGMLIKNTLDQLSTTMDNLSAQFPVIAKSSAADLIGEIQRAIRLFNGKISDNLFANPPFIFMNQPHQWNNLLKANCQAMMTHINRYQNESQPNETVLKELLEGAIKFLKFVNSHAVVKGFPTFARQNELRLGFILEAPAVPVSPNAS